MEKNKQKFFIKLNLLQGDLITKTLKIEVLEVSFYELIVIFAQRKFNFEVTSRQNKTLSFYDVDTSLFEKCKEYNQNKVNNKKGN